MNLAKTGSGRNASRKLVSKQRVFRRASLVLTARVAYTQQLAAALAALAANINPGQLEHRQLLALLQLADSRAVHRAAGTDLRLRERHLRKKRKKHDLILTRYHYTVAWPVV
jgi:hypothetical protein